MKKVTLFEIRLDEDVLVLRGEPTEAAGVQLTGKIVLSCTEPIAAKSLSIRVNALERFRSGSSLFPSTGNIQADLLARRINDLFNGPWGPVMKVFKWEQVIWSDRFVPIREKTTIPAGNHEFPFHWIIRGDSPESVEGFNDASILWDLHATLERTLLSSDLHANKHFRVIRTLPHTALEFTQSMTVENVWPNKVEYSVSTPSKAVVFGSYIPIEVRLTPLLKGLTVHKISVALKEAYELSPPSKETTGTRHILEVDFPGFDDPPHDEDDGAWILKDRIFLPQTLAKCLQDCEVGKIKIRHKLKFAIQLKNPDGHISELRATLPVMLFISQHYLVNDRNEVPEVTNQVTSDSEISAPPAYEVHQLDELFQGVDMDMYLSRTNSPTMLSRSGSAENLQAHSGINSGIASVSSMSGTSSPALTHDVSTAHTSNVSTGSSPAVPSILTIHGHADLVARLQRAHQRPLGSSGSLNALANSTSWTTPSSGRESPNPDSPGEPQLSSSPGNNMDLATMCKVPSYSTAIKVPTRNLSFESAPAYELVSSNPPSRNASSHNLIELARPRPALSRSSSTSGLSTSSPAAESSQHAQGSASASTASQHSQDSYSRAPKLFPQRWRGQ
ncbi:hypothetical protein ABW19_dt0209678 [Dactylella cylindrospora]|nr:hypothetical protein ABW19_dt0209678 [Dactylella cylindrospora]